MTPTPDVSAAPSPAPEVSIPTEGKAYAEWRQTGKLPEPSSGDSATSKEKSAEGEKPKEKAAPVSETGDKQESAKRTDANARIRELIAERKQLEDRLSKLEGKTDVKTEPSPAPKAEQPKGLEPPKKPNLADFSGDDAWQKFEEAKDKWHEDMADYRAELKLQGYVQKQREEAQQRELSTQVDAAKGRYGDEAGATIGSAIDALVAAQMPDAVRGIINDSPVLIDLAYVMGSKPAELAEFLSLAKSNPLAAIRKVVLMEELVKQELTKASPATPASTERGDDGKFVSQKAPEKKTTAAPPPPTEVSGRSSAPPDAIEGAAKSGDFTAYREAANARDLAKRRGR